VNPFVDRLLQTDASTLLGTFVMSASPIVAEAIACCGYDYAVVDAEHSPLDMMQLVHMLQAFSGSATHPIVRVPSNDTVVIKRVLDAGACTILVPFVESAEQAVQAVLATRYAPEGVRGMAGLSRASRFGATPDHFRTANKRQGVVVQLETPRALENLEEIASVEGVNALFVGPTDLAGSMGHYGNAQHPEVQEALRTAVRRCHVVGKPMGTMAGTPELAASYIAAGFNFVAVTSDLGLIVGQARTTLATIRTKAQGPTAASDIVY
jgi:2-keto-3-deoxy-L-rhamnonate aldolase RhmA